MKKHVNAWVQVKREILEQFRQNGGGEDIKLPSEMHLCVLFGVSRSTIREALAKLTQEGLLYKIHGKGSFLRTNLTEINLDITRLYSVTDAINLVGKSLKTTVKSKKEFIADEILAQKLKRETGTPCVMLERIRYADNKLAVYNKNIFPSYVIDGADTTEMEGSLFKFLSSRNIKVSYARSTIIPTLLTKHQLPELETEIELFLQLDETYFSDNGMVIGITSDFYRGSMFSFEVIRTLE